MSCDCKNNGTCNNETWSCKCPSQWTSSDCSIDNNECLYQPCLNNGTCTDIPAGGGFICTCPANFSGTTCNADISVKNILFSKLFFKVIIYYLELQLSEWCM